LDAVLGAEAVGAELRRSVNRSPLFVAATAIAKKDRQNFTRDDAMAIYTASRINQLRTSSSAASHHINLCESTTCGTKQPGANDRRRLRERLRRRRNDRRPA